MAFVAREITDPSISKDTLVTFYFIHTNQQMPFFSVVALATPEATKAEATPWTAAGSAVGS